MRFRYGLMSIALMCAGQGTLAQSDTPTSTESPIWINLGSFSTHLDTGKNYNGDNVGLGIEYGLTPELALLGGRFINSVRRNSNYAAFGWQPLHRGPWRLGAALGLMDGYPAIEHGGVFFAALPTASYEGKRFGINFAFIPTMPQVDGAVVIQFKVRLR
jgi:hypothetical protein